MKILIAITVLALCALSLAQQYPGCEGTPNPFPLCTNQSQLVMTVPNGKKYIYQYDQRLFYVNVMKGSAYEMGLAYGQMMTEEIPNVVSSFFEWGAYFLENNITQIAKLPKFLRNFAGKTGVLLMRAVLDLNYFICKPYTNKRWDDEMKGIAKGTGHKVSVWELRQLNLIPELLKASCSILGGWGVATTTGWPIHLRALDWEQHAPMSQWANVAVYHPTEEGSVPFSNIAWAGFIGSLTGYNSAKIGIGERLRGSPSEDMTIFGTPWTYVLRDTLQFTKSMDQALNYMNNSHRTCSIYLGVGSGFDNTFRIIEYSYKEFNVYTWDDWHFDSNHPKIKDLMWKEYHSGSPCFKNILEQYYPGNISPQLIWQTVAPLGQTGDSQVVVMDYENDVIYVNYPNPFLTSQPAYVRPTLMIDLKQYFNPDVFN